MGSSFRERCRPTSSGMSAETLSSFVAGRRAPFPRLQKQPDGAPSCRSRLSCGWADALPVTDLGSSASPRPGCSANEAQAQMLVACCPLFQWQRIHIPCPREPVAARLYVCVLHLTPRQVKTPKHKLSRTNIFVVAPNQRLLLLGGSDARTLGARHPDSDPYVAAAGWRTELSQIIKT